MQEELKNTVKLLFVRFMIFGLIWSVKIGTVLGAIWRGCPFTFLP